MTLDGHIVANDDPENPYKVVFKDGDNVLAEWPVDTVETGQRRMSSALRAIEMRGLETAQAMTDKLVEHDRV